MTFGTCANCESVNVRTRNGLCGHCLVVIGRAMRHAARGAAEGRNAAESYSEWELETFAEEVAELLTGRKV